jgi:hypothetical protein
MKDLSCSQAALIIAVICVTSLIGYLIADWLATKLRLHKINKVCGRSSWGPIVPYSKANEHKPGAFMVRK